jgi:excisionase family DNA binding protein
MIQIDGDIYLDVHEAAERLGVKPETLYAYVSRGLLKSYRQGVRRRRLYLAHEIDLLLALQPSKGETKSETTAAAEPPFPPAESWAAER